jgi:hypothetical protein
MDETHGMCGGQVEGQVTGSAADQWDVADGSPGDEAVTEPQKTKKGEKQCTKILKATSQTVCRRAANHQSGNRSEP